LFIYFPQKKKFTDVVTICKQQTAVSEEARENTMFLGRTVDYTAEHLEESLRMFCLPDEGLLSGLMNKCEVLKAFL